jgi:hypothetical protein
MSDRRDAYPVTAETIADLRAQIDHWERKEIRRAVCCNENEQRATEAEAKLKVLREWSDVAERTLAANVERVRKLEAVLEQARLLVEQSPKLSRGWLPLRAAIAGAEK